MASEVTLPGVGGVPRRAVEVVGGLAAAFIVFRWWRSRSSSSNTVVPVDTANTAADQSATGYINPGGIAAADNSTSSVITTDAAWTQKVVSDLEALGWNGQTVTTALALYLSGQGLTSDQELIVRAAWSVEGKPPEHPSLPILPVQSPPTTGGGSTGSGGTPSPAAPKLYIADGKTSLNGLASARHTTPNMIIELTAPHQPADVAAYLKLGSYSRALRAGTKWYTP